MPSNILKLRVDGDGDGDADLLGSELDGLASIGNYLRNAGWKGGMLCGIPVRVPSSFDRNSVRRLTSLPNAIVCTPGTAVHCRSANGAAGESSPLIECFGTATLATLIEPDGPNATAYLVTDNYRAVLDYNWLEFLYGLSVTLLADGIIGR